MKSDVWQVRSKIIVWVKNELESLSIWGCYIAELGAGFNKNYFLLKQLRPGG